MKKRSKPKVSVDPYVEGLMGKLLDRLMTLERKMDVVISKVGQKPQPHAGNAVVQHAPPPPSQPRREKTLYEAICADCSKVCEVPFRPSENRPVYCKECWAKRRSRDNAPGMPIIRPVSIPPKPESKLGVAAHLAAPPAAPAKKAKSAAKKTSKKSKKRSK